LFDSDADDDDDDDDDDDEDTYVCLYYTIHKIYQMQSDILPFSVNIGIISKTNLNIFELLLWMYDIFL